MLSYNLKKIYFTVFWLLIFNNAAYANINANKAFDFWTTEGWTLFENDDGVIGPGGGEQNFDAEYLFYKYDTASNELSLGLQTGFDIDDGRVTYDSIDYFAGDLALSFDGNVELGDSNRKSNSYEYAVDFGLYTEDSTGESVESWVSNGNLNNGIDPAGFYQAIKWDNDISYSSSSPFAMTRGAVVSNLSVNDSGSGLVDRLDGTSNQNMSFYRKVTFNLDNLTLASDSFTVDAHWTMSCGNDPINGRIVIDRNAPVPEPSILALFSIGTLSMGVSWLGRRRRTNKNN